MDIIEFVAKGQESVTHTGAEMMERQLDEQRVLTRRLILGMKSSRAIKPNRLGFTKWILKICKLDSSSIMPGLPIYKA